VSRTVVVALDTSDLSVRSLPFAQQIARDWRGHLVFVHVPAAGDSHAAVPLDLQFREIARDLSEMGITADFVLRSTEAALAIIDVADEREADLIVMASHQRRGISRWLNGSVTEDVLAGSNKPVLVIPREGRPRLVRHACAFFYPWTAALSDRRRYSS
jgi:nucleotide-binding universal stress UspA family protein